MTSYEQTPYNSARHEAEKSHHLFECWASKDIAEDQPQNGRANVRARSASDCRIPGPRAEEKTMSRKSPGVGPASVIKVGGGRGFIIEQRLSTAAIRLRKKIRLRPFITYRRVVT